MIYGALEPQTLNYKAMCFKQVVNPQPGRLTVGVPVLLEVGRFRVFGYGGVRRELDIRV